MKQALRLKDRKGIKLNNLSSGAVFGLLPTPMATEVRYERRAKELKEAGGETFHSRKNGETRPNGIADFLDFHGMLPTPIQSDWKGSVGKEKMIRKDGKLRTDSLRNMPQMMGKDSNGATSQLSPLFVEEMMGFPSMWIALPFLSQDGDKKQ